MAYFPSDDPESRDRIRSLMGPGQVDQQIRQAIQFAWMMLPDDRKTVKEVERVRKIASQARKRLTRVGAANPCGTMRRGGMGGLAATCYSQAHRGLNHEAPQRAVHGAADDARDGGGRDRPMGRNDLVAHEPDPGCREEKCSGNHCAIRARRKFQWDASLGGARNRLRRH
jgi:hypothetical protein